MTGFIVEINRRAPKPLHSRTALLFEHKTVCWKKTALNMLNHANKVNLHKNLTKINASNMPNGFKVSVYGVCIDACRAQRYDFSSIVQSLGKNEGVLDLKHMLQVLQQLSHYAR